MTSNLKRRDILVGVAACATTLALSGKTGLAASPETHHVRIKSFTFEPQHIRVKVGDVIVWTNEDLAPHTATAMEGGWDTGEIARSETGSIKVTADMELSYFCAFHPHMKGRIELV
ncbi:plastocyanin/azurin family copper-binding protein [Cohaesibacter gelatinilyticus]|uniref:Plastocyanin n=1 Tax=Cohaesibacter gelatinilyticus TaxID=372072 RepID=A0A285PHA8_9HYPH|nr:plastocyanin/azurin family copper-binding protein [Cohaesibacter gelatinilyticus]SNZ19516.1 Plastocyanin [Cohaesibacter gelatinilyticus]